MSQGNKKLEVWKATKTAFSSLWLHGPRLAKWSLVPVALTMAIELAMQPYIVGLDLITSGEAGVQWTAGPVLAGHVHTALTLAVWTWLELRCYRLFLLGTDADLPAPQMGRIYASLLIFNLLLVTMGTLPETVIGYARLVHGMNGFTAFYFVTVPLYFILSVRLAFVFPAISLGWAWDLRERWSETQGNFWRLFGALMIAFMPYFVFGSVFSSFGVDISNRELTANGLPVVEAIFRGIGSVILLLPGVAVTAAAVAQLTGHSAPGLTGQGPDKNEIAARFD